LAGLAPPWVALKAKLLGLKPIFGCTVTWAAFTVSDTSTDWGEFEAPDELIVMGEE
jgi:hypothetical protein